MRCATIVAGHGARHQQSRSHHRRSAALARDITDESCISACFAWPQLTPPFLSHLQEALHLLEPYCSIPIDCRLVARRQAEAAALGRVQRRLASAAPFAVLLDLASLNRARCIDAALQWLIAHAGTLRTIRLGLQAPPLSIQQARLLARLAAARPDVAAQVRSLVVRTQDLGQAFNAGEPH